MHGCSRLPGACHVIEPVCAPSVEASVYWLAGRADRARARGQREEADRLLLAAWAELDG